MGIAALALLASMGQGSEPLEPPALALDPPNPTFGTIVCGWGTDPSVSVRLTNTAAHAVRVTRVLVGCGCLDPEIDLPLTIDPRGWADMRLKLRLAQMKVGTNSYEISAWDESTLVAKASATYHYDPPILAEPRELLLNLSSPGAVAKHAARLHIRHPLRQTLRPKGDAEDVALSLQPGESPDIVYLVAAAQPTTRPAGRSRHQVAIYRGDEPEPALVIPLLYRVEPPVELRPPVLLIGAVAPGQMVRREVRVVLREGFAIREARCSSPAIRATWAPAGDATVLAIEVLPPESGLLDQTVTLVLDGPQAVEHTLRVMGEAADLAILQREPE
jgi:hypothetical protein